MKSKLLGGVAVAALLIAPRASSAADLKMKPLLKAPPPPIFSWTGCFVGGQVGWGWQRSKITQHGQHTLPSTSFLSSSSGSIDTNGPVFGGQVGCNYQVDKTWVFGAQGTFLGASIKGTGTDPHSGAIDFASNGNNLVYGNGTIGIDTKSIFSATGRIGFTGWSPQTMLYVRGGAAWMNTDYNLANAVLNYNGQNLDVTHFGWTVGGGIEWMFATNWSVFAEYNYYSFDAKSLTVNFGDGTINSIKVQPTVSTVTVGVNLHFGSH
jgi:outer membrane immunogenic protein